MPNFYWIFFVFYIILNVMESSFCVLFLMWYAVSVLLICKIYSHMALMLLSLEVMSLVSMALMLLMMSKLILMYSFFFFFLCFLVGEAVLGLSLMVMSSRVMSSELSSVSI